MHHQHTSDRSSLWAKDSFAVGDEPPKLFASDKDFSKYSVNHSFLRTDKEFEDSVKFTPESRHETRAISSGPGQQIKVAVAP